MRFRPSGLIRDVLSLDEDETERAQIVVATESEMAELPEVWKTFDDGTPLPNWGR